MSKCYYRSNGTTPTRTADRIMAGTELGSRPMAAAFTEAGYPVRSHRIDLI